MSTVPIPAPSNQMYLYPSADQGVWMIEHVGPHAAQIKDLFGSPVIPSPFRLPITGRAVCEALRSKNPGVFVDYFDTEAAWREECEKGEAWEESEKCQG